MENKEEMEKKTEKSSPVTDAVPISAIDPVSEANPDETNEPTVTIGEILEGMDRMEETANMLFATQDPSVCTYPEGYKPRQTVFICLTCTPAPTTAGICYGCSLNCHDDHEIVELYTKRKFKCDCGNSKFGDKKCTLYEEKDPENVYNSYDHNYHGKFCTCEVFYPDDETNQELLQCEICEDWFHQEHMPSKHIDYETEQSSNEQPANNQLTGSLICSSCVKKLPFVSHFQSGKDVLCHSKLTKEQLIPVEGSQPEALVIESFRQKLCKCFDCVRIYEMADCEFLLDDEDDMATYEKASKEKIAAEPQPNEAEEMRELVKEVGMDGVQRIYAGVNDFKRKFAEFMMGFPEGGRPISVEDVKQFTESLKNAKRPRFE